jgi:hypothetical protein
VGDEPVGPVEHAKVKRIESKTFQCNIVFDGAGPVTMRMRIFIDQDAKKVVGVRSINLYDEARQERIKRYDVGTVDFLEEQEMVPR